jgi:hypothetical protein
MVVDVDLQNSIQLDSKFDRSEVLLGNCWEANKERQKNMDFYKKEFYFAMAFVVVVVQSFEYFVPENHLIVVIEFHQIECLVDFAMMELVLDYFDF